MTTPSYKEYASKLSAENAALRADLEKYKQTFIHLDEMIACDRAELVLNDIPMEHLDSDTQFAIDVAYARFKQREEVKS